MTIHYQTTLPQKILQMTGAFLVGKIEKIRASFSLTTHDPFKYDSVLSGTSLSNFEPIFMNDLEKQWGHMVAEWLKRYTSV